MIAPNWKNDVGMAKKNCKAIRYLRYSEFHHNKDSGNHLSLYLKILLAILNPRGANKIKKIENAKENTHSTLNILKSILNEAKQY